MVLALWLTLSKSIEQFLMKFAKNFEVLEKPPAGGPIAVYEYFLVFNVISNSIW